MTAASPASLLPQRAGRPVMDSLVRLEKAIAFTCCLFLAAAFCLIVFLRYVFESDLFAYEEWVLTVAFLLYFVGGALASRGDVHIKADIVEEYIRNPRRKALYHGCVLLFESAVGALLTWFALRMFLHEFERWPDIPTTPVYKIPLAVPRFFIFAGLALMTLHAFLNGYRRLLESRLPAAETAARSVDDGPPAGGGVT